MLSAAQDQQPPESHLPTALSIEATSKTIPAKRSLPDDEVQFISSNPVKRRRNSEQGPAQAMPQTPSASQPFASPSGSENRVTSLPALESFVFSNPFQNFPTRPRRISETISPKQQPQSLPSAPTLDAEVGQSVPPSAGVAPDSVDISQIACLDFNGTPTRPPGFDASRIFSPDGGIMSNLGTSALMPPPLPPLNSHPAIPLAMHSMGIMVPLPQQNWGRPKAPFTSTPMRAQFSPNSSTPRPSLSRQLSMKQAQLREPSPHAFRQYQVRGRSELHGTHMLACLPSPAAAGAGVVPCLQCTKLLRQTQRSSQPSQTQRVPTPHAPAEQDSCNQQSHLAPRLIPVSMPPYGNQAAALQEPRPAPAPGQGQRGQHLELLADISKTIQATFPYQLVAARHGLGPSRVADLVAGMLERSRGWPRATATSTDFALDREA